MLTKSKTKEEVVKVVKRILDDWGEEAECDRCYNRYEGLYFSPDALNEVAQEIAEEIIKLKEEEDG